MTRPLVAELLARADAGAALDPQLHANLAIELTVAGTDRKRALRHAREAVRATSQLMSLTSTALPEAVLVMTLADASREAWTGVQEWLELARQRGRPLAAAIAASIAAHIAARDGDIRQALAFGQQALAADDTLGRGAVHRVHGAAADRRRATPARARALLAERGLLEGDLFPVFPFNVAQYARGCLHAACGDHEIAVTDLLRRHRRDALGHRQPRGDRLALGRGPVAQRPRRQGAARRLARRRSAWPGAGGRRGKSGWRCAPRGLVEGGERGIELLTEAVSVLRQSSARLELARALLDLGAAHRRAGPGPPRATC